MADLSHEAMGKWGNYSLKICCENILDRGRDYFKGHERMRDSDKSSEPRGEKASGSCHETQSKKLGFISCVK